MSSHACRSGCVIDWRIIVALAASFYLLTLVLIWPFFAGDKQRGER